MTNKLFFILFAFTCCFSSCQKDDLDSRLFGTWNVTRVEGKQYVNGTASGVELADASPSGYVRFDDDGSGEQNYYFTLFGTNYPNINEFSWEADDDEIRIDRFNQSDMVWRRITNEPNRQVATYNIVISATENWDYTLTLEK